MKKFKFGLIATVIVVVAGFTVFYSCKKDTNEVANKITPQYHKNGTWVNPFEVAGIAHNAGLYAIFTSLQENENLSWEEICQIIGFTVDEHFGLAQGTTQLPPQEALDVYEEIKTRIEVNDLVSMITFLGDAGILDMGFQSSLISRNNYEILHDYWNQIEMMHVSSSSQIDIEYYVSLTNEVEQEIIGNYYNLLANGTIVIDDGNILYSEYKFVLASVSVASSSSSLWTGGSLSGENSLANSMCAMADAAAALYDPRMPFSPADPNYVNSQAAYSIAISGLEAQHLGIYP
jgi:hypothetical protein